MPNSDVDLKNDIQASRQALAPLAERVRGLLQLWTILESADQLAEAFVNEFDSLSATGKKAYTKALVVEYAKPWSGNRSQALTSLLVKSSGKGPKDYPFLKHLTASTEHAALVELRNKLIAHIDEGFEQQGIKLIGGQVDNIPPNRAQDPGTLDSVFIPVGIQVNAQLPLSLSTKGKLAELREHVAKCLVAATQEFRATATAFRDACFEHLQSLHALSDIVTLEAIPPKSGSTPVALDMEYPSGPLSGTPVTKPMKQTKLGNHLQYAVAVYEPAHSLPEKLEVEGRGYRLVLTHPAKGGTAAWTISFHQHPAPAEKAAPPP